MAKIPENAKQVFEGEIFNVWQWDQKMFDGSMAVFERISRPNTAEVFVVVGDKIIIQRQEQPDTQEFLSMVGGRIEKGEDPLDGAKREVLEETGHASDDWELVRITEPSGKIDWAIYVYVARDAKKVAEQSLDAGEKIKLEFYTLDELIKLVDRGDLSYFDHEIRIDLIRAKYDPEIKKKWEKLLFTA
mgnify:CR=1 FL=1|jgi:ADP-ribose pyrophosphatase